jgi:hypothetical protein
MFIPPPPPLAPVNAEGQVIYLGDYSEQYQKVRDILYYHGTGTARKGKVYRSAYTEIRTKYFEKNTSKARAANNKRAQPPKRPGGK